MKASTCVILLLLTFTPGVFAASADEQAVRDSDANWSKAAAAKDLEKTVSFHAEDAVVLPPNEPAVTVKDGIRNLWKGLFDNVTDISWKATKVEVAKSGDMACLTGTYE